ncbi:MAG: polysaccharide deacetylase family protein, partial [Acidobacteriota bacterium]
MNLCKLAIIGLLLLPCASMAQTHSVAITVDDLPFASGYSRPLNSGDARLAIRVNKKILGALSRNRIPAAGFVIEQQAEQIGIGASTRILKQWTRPGFDLGNHLYSHADVDTHSVEQIEQEVLRGQRMIVPLLQAVSRKPRFLRFPYNHTGDTTQKHDAIAAFLAAYGYRLAPCTIDGSDYEFNSAYVIALAHHDKSSAAKLRTDYIAYTAKEIDWYNK